MPTLYVVATPIGNLGDMTVRSIETLRNVDTVACEDTRVTGRLLEHIGSEARMLSVREENQARGAAKIVELLREGKNVAYCSDAGTPCISDPGMRIVEEARKNGFAVEAAPGVSAVTAAISISGMDAEHFYFAGFLPPKQGARTKELAALASMKCLLVFYEAPHRANDFFDDALAVLGERRVVICRELTKKFEEIIDTTLAGAKRDEWLGELVILVEGAGDAIAHEMPIEEWIAKELELGMHEGSVKEISREAARIYGISGSDAYRLLLSIRDGRRK